MRTISIPATPLALLVALLSGDPVAAQMDGDGGRGARSTAIDTVFASELEGPGAERYAGRTVWITGDLIRLGNEEFDDDFGVADRTGIVPIDFDRDVIEDGELVAALLGGDRVEVTGTLSIYANDPSDPIGPRIEVIRVDDIVFLSAPPYPLAAAIFGTVALVLLIMHLVTRQRNAERRALELGEFSRQLHRKDAILEAISYAAEQFLRSPAWEESLPRALERLGRAAAAGRVTVHEALRLPDGAMRIAVRAEWVDPSKQSLGAATPFAQADIAGLGLDRWAAMLLQDRLVVGCTSSFPPAERQYLDARGIRSILVIPIWVRDSVWGVLVFTDHTVERIWSGTEREVLLAAGGMIGAAVERTRAEETLIEVEDRFRQMAEHIREVFYMTDAETYEVLYLSPAYEEVWGRTREETLANPLAFTEAILAEDRHVMFGDMELPASDWGERERQLEYRIRRPDGSIRWIRNRSVQIRRPDDTPYRVAGVCTDITEQKQLEEELRRANRIEAIGHLAAGIAHEINTPIQYIGGNLEFLDSSYDDLRSALGAYQELLREARAGAVTPERVTEIAAAVQAADIDFFLREAPKASAQALDGVRRVSEIVRAMKEFSHPGTGQRIPIDLNQAIRSTTTVARNEWKYVAELVTELDETLPPVCCMPGEVNQAILNLVVNAAHAVADRQQAERTHQPGVITISTARAGDAVEIRVSDTGTGIPEEIRERIFDPFFTTKEVGRGTGQGLTFVHSIIVDRHGGTVSLETVSGVGTTFIVRLPHHSEETDFSEAA